MQTGVCKYLCFFVFLAAGPGNLRAQDTDSSYALKPVQVNGLRYPTLYTGVKLYYLDSTLTKQYTGKSLADMLSAHSTIFIKSYGPGMLSSPGFRGGNASQTALLWHGFNLQSPMNGQSDFSLIPAYLLSSAAIQYGSPAAMFGSGNISGAVHLNTEPLRTHSTEYMLGTGSFGSYMAGLKWNRQYNKLSVSEKVYANHAKNNYTYYNSDLLQPTAQSVMQGQKKHAAHAEISGSAWLQELSYRHGIYHKSSLSTWLQQNLRNIPPSLQSTDVAATQTDKTLRLLADHQFKKASFETQLRYGWLHDVLSYTDAHTPAVRSTSNVNQVGADFFYYSKWYEIQAGLMAMIQDAHLSTEPAHWQQNRQALFTSVKSYLFDRCLQQQFSLRQEWANTGILPLMPAYGIQYLAGKALKISANIARSYRLPTFNDLYWPQMGNPALKPEEGWNQELAMHYSTHVKSVQFKSSLSAYNKNISNWIIWLPGSNGLSSPQNIYEVWTRGAELEWQLIKATNNITLEAQGMHEYCLASNEKSDIPNDASLHQQLIYTPKIKHRASVKISHRMYSLSWLFQYNGIRYTASDASAWLNPYTLHNLYFSRIFRIKQKQLELQGSLNNLFNADIQVVAGRPVPLRNFQITLIYTN